MKARRTENQLTPSVTKASDLKLRARDRFHLKLLEQEVTMFLMLRAPVYLCDINWVCERRGFNTTERVSLMRAITKCGLWQGATQ